MEEIRSWSDNGTYVKCVEEAITNYKKFKKFKSDKRYQFVLEHASQEQGHQNLEIIKKDNPELLNKKNISTFKANDLLGSPKTYNYGEEYGNFRLQLLLILKYFQIYILYLI